MPVRRRTPTEPAPLGAFVGVVLLALAASVMSSPMHFSYGLIVAVTPILPGVAVALAGILFWRRLLGRGLWRAGACVVAGGVAAFVLLLFPVIGWHAPERARRTLGGVEYAVHAMRMGKDGACYGLATRRSVAGLFDVLDVRAANWGGRSPSSPQFVRPAGEDSESVSIHEDRSGRVFVLLGTEVVLVFDPASGQAVDEDATRRFSPFHLVRDAGSDEDLRQMATRLKTVVDFASSTRGSLVGTGEIGWWGEDWFPLESVLLEEAASPSPWVRSAVRTLAEAGGPVVYPRLAAKPR